MCAAPQNSGIFSPSPPQPPFHGGERVLSFHHAGPRTVQVRGTGSQHRISAPDLGIRSRGWMARWISVKGPRDPAFSRRHGAAPSPSLAIPAIHPIHADRSRRRSAHVPRLSRSPDVRPRAHGRVDAATDSGRAAPDGLRGNAQPRFAHPLCARGCAPLGAVVHADHGATAPAWEPPDLTWPGLPSRPADTRGARPHGGSTSDMFAVEHRPTQPCCAPGTTLPPHDRRVPRHQPGRFFISQETTSRRDLGEKSGPTPARKKKLKEKHPMDDAVRCRDPVSRRRRGPVAKA